MRRPAILAAGLFLIATAAEAVKVYVPFAANAVIDGRQVRTRLLVSNQAPVSRAFIARFTPQGNSPFYREVAARLGPRGAANAGVALDDVVLAGELGMIEVSGAPQIHVTSVLEVLDGEDRYVVQVPAIAAADFALASAFVVLQSEIDFAASAAFAGVLNLASAGAGVVCALNVFRPEGGIVGRSFPRPAKGLLIADVEDFLAPPVPLTGRAEATCTGGQTFAYFLVRESKPPFLRYVPPSAKVGDGVP